MRERGRRVRAGRAWLPRLALCTLGLLLLGFGCERESTPREAEERRMGMVEQQIEARGVKHPLVLRAMRKVPRHLFVSPELAERAYDDRPLAIGAGQTISQPYVVAAMTELLDPEPGDRVLDIGTGSGYQAAVLAEIVSQVYSIEIVPELARSARTRLRELGYHNVEVIEGDGYRGLLERAPFDGILVAAAPGHVPPALIEQLAPGASLVIPVGDHEQELLVIESTPQGPQRRTVFPVRFVPMTGEAERRD